MNNENPGSTLADEIRYENKKLAAIRKENEKRDCMLEENRPLSKIERDRNQVWNELLMARDMVAVQERALDRARNDERAAKNKLDALNAELAKEQGNEDPQI